MSTLPKLLIFGCLGQVGTELRRQLPAGQEVLAVDRDECDLLVEGNARKLIQGYRPAAVINAAAYTAVDRAETDVALADCLNAGAAGEMAVAARECGALFLHFSTDYVFNGENEQPWVEEDATGPLNAYGETKLAGERAVLAAGGAAFIFRTSWVYGSHGANFLLTMLRLGKTKEELSVVCDQVGGPTWSHSLAELSLHTVRRFATPLGGVDFAAACAASGVYHATCGGVTSWHGFAEAIFAEARERGIALAVREVKAIPTSAYPTPARRPRYSVMCNAKLNRELGFTLPEWRAALGHVMDEVAAVKP